jgi:hypothetical protein
MKKLNKELLFLLLVVLLTGILSACSDADVASTNVSTAADNFEINRRVIFYNGITGEYMLEIDGYCSLGNSDEPGSLSVVCKVGPGLYKKHFLGLSDNVTYFVEQVDPAPANVYNYRVIFKPSVIVPDMELNTP